MKKTIAITFLLTIILITTFSSHAEARGRYGSLRVGGYTSHGKGSHYIGGYVRTGHTLKYYLTH